MSSLAPEPTFPDWNPHFTPQWLSKKLVSYLPQHFSGTIVDPACGAGNLLIAAAQRFGAPEKESTALHLVGIDVSKKALNACRASLSSLLPNGNFVTLKADFLAALLPNVDGPTAVVMNPPFKGYGRLAIRTRRRIVTSLQMKGRFNLGYAFVRRAVSLYRPSELVALLPSNWMYSKRSSFRAELDSFGGSWDWEDVGGNVFKGLNVHVGILIWRSKSADRSVVRKDAPLVSPTAHGFEVRQGVATGSDTSFIGIAKSAPSLGRVVDAVRGRDVGRKASIPIWFPPSGTESAAKSLVNEIGSEIIARLRARSCVRTGRRALFEYHESVPAWFLAGPKLLVPEIVVGRMRVELDSAGTKFPLHSVIAVRVPSVAAGKRLRRYLLTATEQQRLLSNAPRLSGGATRLQVALLRDALARWSPSQARTGRK